MKQTTKGDGTTYDKLCRIQKETDAKGEKIDEKDRCRVALFVGGPHVFPLEKGRGEEARSRPSKSHEKHFLPPDLV